MEFDFNDVIAYEESQAFEDQYADDFDALNNLQDDCDLPNLQPHSKSKCKTESAKEKPDPVRKLFSDNEAIVTNENDLIIDEGDAFSMSPIKKRCRVDSEEDVYLPPSKKPSMPTTLDVDKDEAQRKREEKRKKALTGSPEVIEKILRRRERYNMDSNTADLFQNDKDFQSIKQRPFQLTKVLHHPPHCDYMPATSSGGCRVYMRMRKKQSNSETVSNISQGSLLTEDIAKLRQAVQNQKLNAVYKESMRITQQVRNENHRINEEEEINALSAAIDMDSDVARQALAVDLSFEQSKTEESIAQEITTENSQANSELWLNKYAPTQYTHLLSDETVNRSVLKWLKMWDPVVFGREYKPRKDPNHEEKEANNFQNKFKKYNILEHIDDKVDEFKRPIWKAALLCGTPGLGKTTLAHIIAKHAGYHVVEMNASDDRSADAFKRKLEETTQMTSVLTSDNRPNCLIIDEIDGAPVAAINVLLAAMNKGSQKKAKPGKLKRKDSSGILMRPIICICNDLYTPALRQLRQQSLVLHFPPTSSATLASRLAQLCRIQQLQCDTTTLLNLCEKAENDIRSCINTLQFIQSQGTKRLDLQMIKSLEIGQKDQHKSIFTVWHEIFQLPKNKRKTDKNTESLKLDYHLSNQKLSQFSARFYAIYQMVCANGDYEKTLQGVYENFLLMKFKDPDMSGLRKAYEWLELYDCLNTSVLSHQEYGLFQYIPFLFVLYHLLFSCIKVPRIPYPTTNSEFLKQKQKNENLLHMMFIDMNPQIQCFASRRNVTQDILPYLLLIMTPQIRPVNVQLFNTYERRQLRDLVQTMLQYNLTYHQERNEDGQYNYTLEPNVADVCLFEGMQEHMKLTYANKQMIAKEVELERMRRSENLLQSHSKKNLPPTVFATPNKKSKKVSTKSNNTTPNKTVTPSKNLPNHLQRLEDKIANSQIIKEKPVIDFFSRFKKLERIETDDNSSSKSMKSAPRDPGIGNSQIWYRFNEGFSNAVRRTIYVKDFL